MTVEEALARVYAYIGSLKNISPKSEQQKISKDDNMEFAVVVGSSLEYRIERKPDIRPYTDKRNSDKGYFCPRCGDTIGTVGIPFDIDDARYCRCCGQAILWDLKWEEEEE